MVPLMGHPREKDTAWSQFYRQFQCLLFTQVRHVPPVAGLERVDHQDLATANGLHGRGRHPTHIAHIHNITETEREARLVVSVLDGDGAKPQAARTGRGAIGGPSRGSAAIQHAAIQHAASGAGGTQPLPRLQLAKGQFGHQPLPVAYFGSTKYGNAVRTRSSVRASPQTGIEDPPHRCIADRRAGRCPARRCKTTCPHRPPRSRTDARFAAPRSADIGAG
eukprot:ctg_393.g204